MTKKALISLLSSLDDLDELVFICDDPTNSKFEIGEEFHSAYTWHREPGHITEVHLEKR